MTNKYESFGGGVDPEEKLDSPEKIERTKFEDLDDDERAQYEAYMADHPEISVSERKEAGPEILEFEAMIDTKRLHDRLTILDKDKFEEIRKAIRGLI